MHPVIDLVHLVHFSPILVDRIEDFDDLNSSLRTTILRKRECDKGLQRSNKGGWHSDEALLNWIEQEPRERLLKFITAGVGCMITALSEDRPPAKINVIAWANVSELGDYNSLHIHPGSTWSGTYYVDDGGTLSGKIVFPDPRTAVQMMTSSLNPLRTNDIEFDPIAGTLLIFPSWMQHHVTPHAGDRPRISISFNVAEI